MTRCRTALTTAALACLTAVGLTACGFVMPLDPHASEPSEPRADPGERPGSSAPVGGPLGEAVDEATSGPSGQTPGEPGSVPGSPLEPPVSWEQLAPVLAVRVADLYATIVDVRDGSAAPEAMLEHATAEVADGLVASFGSDLPEGTAISGHPRVIGLITDNWTGEAPPFAHVCLDHDDMLLTSPDGQTRPVTQSPTVRTMLFQVDGGRFVVSGVFDLADGAENPCPL